MKYRKRHDPHMYSSSGISSQQRELKIVSILQDLAQTLFSRKVKGIEYEICNTCFTTAGKVQRTLPCYVNSRSCRECQHLDCRGKNIIVNRCNTQNQEQLAAGARFNGFLKFPSLSHREVFLT